MLYIVDANNLAGKLKMLEEENFDKKLINLIQEYNSIKKTNIILVFDSNDPMGDKITIDKRLTVIYSPRDQYFKSADDKIYELADRKLFNPSFKDQITVVTEDNELIKRLEKIFERAEKEFLLIKSSQYLIRMKKLTQKEDIQEKIPEDEAKRITEELKSIW